MKKIIIANWKCNPTTSKEAQKMISFLKQGLKKVKKAEVVICPPFVYLASSKFQESRVKLGSQDCFWEEKGAFTGEISAKMLKDLGVKYVILGHSERRYIFGETSESVAKKVKAVLNLSLTPIVCIGETLQDRKETKTFQVIEAQLKQSLQGIAKNQINKVILAYEPVWAIGTGNNCSSDEALTVSLFLRKLILNIAGRKAVQGLRILYGGSVSVDNAVEYLQNDSINGLLVGGASLDSKEFISIVKSVNGF